MSEPVQAALSVEKNIQALFNRQQAFIDAQAEYIMAGNDVLASIMGCFTVLSGRVSEIVDFLNGDTSPTETSDNEQEYAPEATPDVSTRAYEKVLQDLAEMQRRLTGGGE